MSDEEKKEAANATPPEGTEEQEQASAPVIAVEPDLEFVKTVSEWGGGDLKTCFQCATCSVVCPLAPDINPFPRKEMIWAQWGFKDKLANDPDLWLCHRCNDCSENCPRGVKTGDVMAALRSYAYQAHAFPRFLGRWINRPAMLPLLLALPALAVWAIMNYAGKFSPPLGETASLHSRYWGNMIEPWPYLDLAFIVAVLFVLLSFSVSLRRVWSGFMNSGVQPDITPKISKIEALSRAVLDILYHNRFKECGTAQARRSPHMLILFGFAGLFATTALVFIGMYAPLWIGKLEWALHTPLPLGHPIKILGNASTIAISIGLFLVIARRSNPDKALEHGRNSYQDLLFLGVLTVVVLTGLFSEIFRLAASHTLAAASYYTHLTMVLFLLFYAPYSKFAHVVYHTAAVTWAHHVGRELKTLPVVAGAPAKEEKTEAA
jgi:quinone-modifying oxidoreductase, subunit QmoC